MESRIDHIKREHIKFSVIVPVYQEEKYIRKYLESIQAQTYTTYETIVIDDGSDDLSPVICDEIAEKDHRFKVIHKERAGLVSARNTGVKKATGDYIVYVDGDDWINPNLLETLHGIISSQNVKLDMVLYGADEVYFDHVGKITNKVPDGLYDKSRLESIYPYMFTDTRKAFRAGEVIFGHS